MQFIAESNTAKVDPEECKKGPKVDPEESKKRKPKVVPGPPGYPLIGNLFQLQSGRLHHQAVDWGQQYGDIFRLNILGKRLVFLNTSRLIRRAFARIGSNAMDNRVKTFAGTHVCLRSIAMSENVEFSLKQKTVFVNVLAEWSKQTSSSNEKLAECFWNHASVCGTSDVDVKEAILRPVLLDLITDQVSDLIFSLLIFFSA